MTETKKIVKTNVSEEEKTACYQMNKRKGREWSKETACYHMNQNQIKWLRQ